MTAPSTTVASFDFRAARDAIWGIQRTATGGFLRAVRRPDLTRSERALLLALVEFAPNINPSLATLEVMLETDERAIKRLVRSLEIKGYLAVTRPPGRRSKYHLQIPEPPTTTSPPDETPRQTVTPYHPVTPPPTTTSPPPPSIPSPEADKRSRQGSGQDHPLDADAPERVAPGPVSAPASSKKASKGSKPKGKTEPPNPHAAGLRDHYVAELKRLRGADAVFVGSQWGRAMKALGAMANAAGPDRAKQAITAALSSEFCHKVQPWEIANDLNRHLAKVPQTRPATLAIQRHGSNLRTSTDADDWGVPESVVTP